METKIRNKIKKFLETYNDKTKTKISINNVIALMEWSYREGYSDAADNIKEYAEINANLFKEEQEIKKLNVHGVKIPAWLNTKEYGGDKNE